MLRLCSNIAGNYVRICFMKIHGKKFELHTTNQKLFRMKHFSRLLSIAVVAAFFALSACKDDDEPNLSRTELLTMKPWKITGIAIVGFGGATPPESFQADDTFAFNTDGTYVFNEGATKEDPADPQEITGTWEFAENETVLKITFSGITLSKDIKELSTSVLKVQYNFLIDIEETYGH